MHDQGIILSGSLSCSLCLALHEKMDDALLHCTDIMLRSAAAPFQEQEENSRAVRPQGREDRMAEGLFLLMLLVGFFCHLEVFAPSAEPLGLLTMFQLIQRLKSAVTSYMQKETTTVLADIARLSLITEGK